MRLDLYQSETAQIAREQGGMLDEAKAALEKGLALTRLERNGVLHALQILIENAIGKAKHMIKAAGEPVPVSAYDAFTLLASFSTQPIGDLSRWNAFIGLRNRIVHDYMNIDMSQAMDLVRAGDFRFLTDFLLAPLPKRREPRT